MKLAERFKVGIDRASKQGDYWAISLIEHSKGVDYVLQSWIGKEADSVIAVYSAARDEALEEAAKVADRFKQPLIGEEIRALKSRP